MSDYIQRTQEENEILVASALASVRFSDYKTQRELDFAIAKRVSRSMHYLHKNAVPMRIAASIRIYAEIIDVTFEESSQCYIISFHAIGSEDSGEVETIRTDRIAGHNGNLVQTFMREGDKDKLIGKRAFIYKLNEPSSKGVGQTVRICPFLDILG